MYCLIKSCRNWPTTIKLTLFAQSGVLCPLRPWNKKLISSPTQPGNKGREECQVQNKFNERTVPSAANSKNKLLLDLTGPGSEYS